MAGEKILKVTDGANDVYWTPGHDHQEAIYTFGEDIKTETVLAIPHDPNLTEFENIEAAWQRAVAELE